MNKTRKACGVEEANSCKSSNRRNVKLSVRDKIKVQVAVFAFRVYSYCYSATSSFLL
jgi:hypothetical protein